jgi:rhodanese-related sulfurtransferase
MNNVIRLAMFIRGAWIGIMGSVGRDSALNPKELDMENYNLQQAREHFAGRVAYTTGVHELEVLINQGKGNFQVVDVRFPGDYAQGHAPGAINLPRGKWQNPAGLRKDSTLYVYCYDQTCHLAAEASLELVKQGFHAVEVEGGWERWVQKGFRVETVAVAA